VVLRTEVNQVVGLSYCVQYRSTSSSSKPMVFLNWGAATACPGSSRPDHRFASSHGLSLRLMQTEQRVPKVIRFSQARQSPSVPKSTKDSAEGLEGSVVALPARNRLSGNTFDEIGEVCEGSKGSDGCG
jgi:hypothetical protein